MFMVIGVWQLDPQLRATQRQLLDTLYDTVRTVYAESSDRWLTTLRSAA